MATYAAYRHVELDKIGYGKRRVLKPPGGGTSDIFSAADQLDSPRKARIAKNGITLSLSGPSPTIDSASYKPGNDSHNRLFGPPEPAARPPPTRPNRPKSSIHLGDASTSDEPTEPKPIEEGQQAEEEEVEPEPVEEKEKEAVVEPNWQGASFLGLKSRPCIKIGASPKMRNCVTGEGCEAPDHYNIKVIRQRDGNPVTGEGYDAPKPVATPSQMNGIGPQEPPKNRVPPGGFSSGLW